MESHNYYLNQLYPLQDKFLRFFEKNNDGRFYLTGGTALSRAYLHHRFSDDLDLFVNWDDRFGVWTERIVDELQRQDRWQTQVVLKDQYFVRALLLRDDLTLKVEMINDVGSRVGIPHVDPRYPELGRIDSPENILANKLTALIGRDEPRDVADVWGLCGKLGLSLRAALSGAQNKSSGIYPADLARRLCQATQADWEAVRWIEPPACEIFLAELQTLGDELLLLR